MVISVRDIYISGGVNGHAFRVPEPREIRRPVAVPGEPVVLRRRCLSQETCACNRRYYTATGDLADTVIVGVGNINVSVAVGGQSYRGCKPRITTCAVGIIEYPCAASERRNHALGCDFPDRAVVEFSHIDISISVGCQPLRTRKTRRTSGAVCAASRRSASQ